MKIKRTYLSQALATLMLAATTGIGVAADAQIPAVDEAERVGTMGLNDSIATAQRLSFSTRALKINGALGIGGEDLTTPAIPDVDFYSFEAEAGDTLTIDIDQGIKLKAQHLRSVDLSVALYGPLPETKKKRENLNVALRDPIDEGSDDRRDPRIDNFKIDVRGTYVVGVINDRRTLGDNGAIGGTSLAGNSNGRYTLFISGVTPKVQQINIEVKPGHEGDAPVNLKAKGVIPVALLSSHATATSPAFDALKVKPESLTFGFTGDETSWVRCSKEGLDVNADTLLDLVCHFDNQSAMANWEPDQVEGIVRGETYKGDRFEGYGRLKIVPKNH